MGDLQREVAAFPRPRRLAAAGPLTRHASRAIKSYLSPPPAPGGGSGSFDTGDRSGSESGSGSFGGGASGGSGCKLDLDFLKERPAFKNFNLLNLVEDKILLFNLKNRVLSD